ncbi:uncharacterized protein LOC129571742 [Sitodiplosis mosellana]|uniref:uncharacterized protein LOC129571742 n=1 Tax=Sitodiplosis mosellana TaxID=263140 RepID=UPI0024438582|nr:uncharacterized protein LOC129571742 [Sitodiplosis mosellana]
MADASTKTSQKRQREEDNEQNPKCQRQEVVEVLNEAEDAVEVGPSDIGYMSTDSGEDDQHLTNSEDVSEEEVECSRITERSSSPSLENNVDLDNLILNKLLTQTELSYRRKKAIEMVFAQKYGTDWLYLNNHSDLSIENWIKVLRFFGHMITKLDIVYWMISPENCIEIDRCVNEYCADSLIELKIKDAPTYIMNHFKKPFTKIETIKFEHCTLSSNSTDFNRWFPMMRRLVFSSYNEFSERRCIEAPFPHLKELEFWLDHWKSFTKSNVAQTLRMNPNLLKLKIDGSIKLDGAFLRNASHHLQLLETLEFDLDNEVFQADVSKAKFKHLKILSIKYSHGSDLVPSIPLLCDQLKEFTFKTVNCKWNDECGMLHELYDFINNHLSLDKLTLNIFDNDSPAMKTVDKMQLARACSTLTQIDFCYCEFSANEALDFIKQCKSLKSLKFRFGEDESDSTFEEFEKSLSNEWQATETRPYVEVNRTINTINEDEPGDFEELIESTGSIENTQSDGNAPSSETIEPEIMETTDDENISQSLSNSMTMESSDSGEEDLDDVFNVLIHMELEDLLQAAESNAQRKMAIETVFLAKFQLETVKCSPSYDQTIEYQNGIISIGDITVCLNFLHCFGHLIKKFQMEFDDDELLCHLNEYCADTLIELNISSRSKKK